jgi:5-formyltetrahydrofolate cyclo-ligase
MNAGELKKAKRDLRRTVLAARDALGEADRLARSAAIHNRFLALPEVERTGTVMLFWSFGSEVSTPPLVEGLHARGTRVALPRIRAPKELEVVAYAPGDPVRETSFGAREPTGGAVMDPAAVDVVVTPGVAFDLAGRRIGYGGGFYDRFLLLTRPDAPRVGLAFDLQVLDEELPAGAFDLGVDLIVTETRTLRCPPGTAST